MSNYAICKLPEWAEVPREAYLHCAETAPWGLGKVKEFTPLLDRIRACIPVKGTRDWVKDIHVLVKFGEVIPPHAHDEWTAVFYVDPGDPVCAIVVDGERVEPSPGDVIVLPPGTTHEVEKSESLRTRISFAMLVEGN